MKIALLVFHDPLTAPDGTARFGRELALELAGAGHAVEVVHGAAPGGPRGTREVGGARFVALAYGPLATGGSLLLSLRALRHLAREHRRAPYDAVVSLGPPFTLTLVARRPLRGARTVYYAQGCMLSEWAALRWLYGERGPGFALGREARYAKMALFEGTLVRHSDVVLASSDHTRRCLLRYGVPPGRVALCYLGLRDPFPRGPPPGAGEAVLHVATDHARKGTALLLRALGILAERFGLRPPAWIVGRPEARYVALARRLGVAAEFLGRLPEADLLGRYAACGLLALPSLDEGFGLPVLEAAFAGRPAVVTGVACLPELVRDGVDGLVVPPANPGAFAAGLRALLTDPQARARMGERAREKAQRFTIGATAARFLEALGQAPGGRRAIP